MVLIVIYFLVFLCLLVLYFVPGILPGSIFLVIPPIGRLIHIDLESMVFLVLGLFLVALLLMYIFSRKLDKRIAEVSVIVGSVDQRLQELGVSLEQSMQMYDRMTTSRSHDEKLQDDDGDEEIKVSVKEEEFDISEVLDSKTLKLLFRCGYPQPNE